MSYTINNVAPLLQYAFPVLCLLQKVALEEYSLRISAKNIGNLYYLPLKKTTDVQCSLERKALYAVCFFSFSPEIEMILLISVCSIRVSYTKMPKSGR